MSDVPNVIDAEDDDDLIEGPDPLTPREEVFCAAYANPESATYGRATKSAEVAGYKGQPHASAWRLRRRPRVVAKIEEYQRATMATIGKVFSDLENQRLLALAKDPPDIQAANRSSELQGKHLAMFTDRVVVDEVVVHEYDAVRAVECSRIARLLIEEDGDRLLGLPAPGESAALGALPDVEGKSKLNSGQKENEQ